MRLSLWKGQHFDLGESVKLIIGVNSPTGLRHLARPSLDALGSAYVEGDLEPVLEVADQPAHYAVKPVGRFGRIVRSVCRTRKVDTEVIAYHYDISNDCYRLWLDENMVYSCASFKDRADSQEDTQIQKLDHVLRKLRL